MNLPIMKFGVIAFLLLAGFQHMNSQSGLPEVFKNEDIPAQYKYLQEHTRIYEDYRAIREDMYRAISKNSVDSLNAAKTRINLLVEETEMLNTRIDSINKTLASSNTELNKMTRTKNSIRVLGIEINKTTYNSITWLIIAALIALLGIGYLTFKQNRVTTLKTRKELSDLLAEFEEYKKKTRIEREKTTMEHFNEIKKLKSTLPGGSRL